MSTAALDFGDALGAAQQPWLDLLKTGRFPANDGDTPKAGILVQPEWRALLETSVAQDGSNWEAWLHLGVIRLHDGDLQGAQQAWETSLARKRTAWALRNLAVLARREGSIDRAADLYREAQQLRPDLLPLLIETGRTLIDAGAPAEFLALLEAQPPSIRDNGRIHLLEVEGGLAVGDLDRVGRLFRDGFEIVDYQEGDEILTELWLRYHAEQISRDEGVPVDDALRARVQHEHPLPSQYDFRMKAE
jgi:tetratricopeptide (TPR) repeat protein